jgi:hypothetical protein
MLATSRVRHRHLLVRACVGLLPVAVVIAGCGDSGNLGAGVRSAASSPAASSSSPTPVPTLPGPNPTATSIPQAAVGRATAPPVPACRPQRCRVDQTARLADGYELKVWSVPGGAAHPVLQLIRNARSIAWMVLFRGQASASRLTCDASASVPNCVIISPLGLHSAIGEMVLVPAGRLVDTAAFAVATTPGLAAADLDHDRYLDVTARDSDYQPNFAQGHLFDRTYRYDAAQHRFVSTGCTARLTDPAHTRAPARLQTGDCPRI